MTTAVKCSASSLPVIRNLPSSGLFTLRDEVSHCRIGPAADSFQSPHKAISLSQFSQTRLPLLSINKLTCLPTPITSTISVSACYTRVDIRERSGMFVEPFPVPKTGSLSALLLLCCPSLSTLPSWPKAKPDSISAQKSRA